MLKHKRLANSSSASPLPKGIIQSSTKSLAKARNIPVMPPIEDKDALRRGNRI